MQRIVNFSLNHQPLVVLAWALIALAGVRAMLQLPIDAVPDVTNVQVQVLTNAPGLSPEDVERFITFPVETVMNGIPDIEDLRSVSKFGLSVVTVVFEEGTDLYWARQQIDQRLVEAREVIPEGYGQPEMGPISSGLGEIYQFEVHGEGYSAMELRSILDWQVNYQLRSVPGVVEINAFGGELKTYQVTLEPHKLNALDMTVRDVFQALEANNRNVGGGYIARQGEQYLIRGEGLVSELNDLETIVIKHAGQSERDQVGTPIFIADIGRVEFAPMIRQGAVTRDGKGEAVIGIVMMLMGENSRVVAAAVDRKIETIRVGLPEGVRIDTFYNRTELVDQTISTVVKNLLEGGLLVVLVLLLLLGHLRAGLIVALAIPLSMLVALIAMRLFGISGNLMSLGALDFGLIVDGSVVMIENVMRRLHQQRDEGGHHLEKVRSACSQVARPVVFAVGIIILVYIPILGLRGIEGKMFRPMAFTVVFALLGSLVCALTLMPVLASLFLKRVPGHHPLLFRLATRCYEPILSWCVRRTKSVVALALTLFLASLSLIPFLGAEFMPRLDEGSIAMQIWRLPSISLEKANEISTWAEQVLMAEFPEVKTVVSRTGRAEIATDPMGVEISDTYVMLTPSDTWRFETKEALVEEMEHSLNDRVPGAVFSFSQPIQLRVSELISGVRSDLAVKLYGDELTLLEAKAAEMVSLIKTVPGAADVKAEQVLGLPSLRIKINREAMARYGLNAEDVLDVVETMGGKSVGVVLEGQRRFDLRVRLDEKARRSKEDLENLLIAVPASPHIRVPLAQVAQVILEEGPAQISRDQVSRRISVEANIRGRDLASFVAETQELLHEQLELPNGWYLTWGGQFENLSAASKRLAMLVPVALILIFFMLYSTFQSWGWAMLIFLNVPLAVTGGLMALALRGYPFSISAGVGFIALFGIAVLNGVVLISHVVEARNHSGVLEAVVAGARARLRPVLMTALVAALGFVPMALSQGAGAEVQRPLATVVIGGLLTSTLLTLLVIPSVASWFAPKSRKIGDDLALT